MHAQMLQNRKLILIALLAVAGPAAFAGNSDRGKGKAQTSSQFSGPKVNRGTVTHSLDGKMHVLTLSPDFVIPDTPDPHWQVIDSKGVIHLLERLSIKGDRTHLSIVLPATVRDVVKVQIWCAWAEVVLGEASFTNKIATS